MKIGAPYLHRMKVSAFEVTSLFTHIVSGRYDLRAIARPALLAGVNVGMADTKHWEAVTVPTEIATAAKQALMGTLPFKSDKHVLAMALADLLLADLERYPRLK